MNAQKQAEMIATAARHSETDGFQCILNRPENTGDSVA
jgi:hypothetical protein